MKKSTLRQIIKEEIASVLKENTPENVRSIVADYTDIDGFMFDVIKAINDLGLGYAEEDPSTSGTDSVGMLIGKTESDVAKFRDEMMDAFGDDEGDM